MKWFKLLWILDAIVTLIALLFFFAGLNDGTVSSFNISLWAGLLAVLLGILFGSLVLYSKKKIILANSILLIPVLPALLYLLFILIIFFQEHAGINHHCIHLP